LLDALVLMLPQAILRAGVSTGGCYKAADFRTVARIIEAAWRLDWRHRISGLATATKDDHD
jgi:hypothetical protein